MRKTILDIHRWMSLAVATLWFLQAITGTLISFRGNIDDFLMGAKASQVMPAELGGRIDALQADGATVWSMWSSGGVKGQFDVYYTKDDVDYTLRLNGAGEELRHRPDSNLYSDGALFESLTQFHKNMFLGDVGYTFFAISAVLLITNIILGFVYGWKNRKKLGQLTKIGKPGSVAYLKGLHWTIGYAGAPFAVIIVSLGLLLSYSDTIEEWVGAGLPDTTVESIDGEAITSGQAMSIVGKLYNLEKMAAFRPINEYRDYYEIRLKSDGEMPRLYGASTVRISASGDVLLNVDASTMNASHQFANALYPAHTGQILGPPGRLVNFAVGIWLIAMMVLGFWSWTKRKIG